MSPLYVTPPCGMHEHGYSTHGVRRTTKTFQLHVNDKSWKTPGDLLWRAFACQLKHSR